MEHHRTSAVVTGLLTVASTAPAAVTAIAFEPVQITHAPTAMLYQSWDLYVTTDTDWTLMEVLATVEATIDAT